MSYGTLTLTAQTGTGEVGQAILYTATVLDASGSPVNPATLTLTLSGAATLTVPIGSWTTGSTGVFTYTYLPTVGGVLAANATATVPNAADDVTIEVGNSSGVALADIKAHLNITNSTDDVELQRVLNATLDVVEDIKGPVTPLQVTDTDYADPTQPGFGAQTMWLSQWPIVSVDAVTQDTTTFSSDPTVSPYYVVNPGGTVTLYGCTSRQPVTVTYTVGQTLNNADKQAIAEIVRHLWKPQSGVRMSSQQNPEYMPSRQAILTEATLLFGTRIRPPVAR